MKLHAPSYTVKGFTLIELLVVISIIGLLSSIVLSSLTSARDKGRIGAAQQFASHMHISEGADGMIFFNFDEGTGGVTTDTTGLGNTGTINGAVWSTDTPTRRGGSLFFDGSDYVQVPYSVSHTLSQSGFTYSAWIKPTAYSNPYNMFMGQQLPYFNVGGGANNQKLHMSMSAAAAQRNVYGVTDVTLSNWHHVAATYDSTGYMRVYLDGKLDGTAGPYLVPVSSSSNFFVGQWSSAGTYRFTGYVDDVRFYNHALGVAQIEKLYAEGLTNPTYALLEHK